MFGIFFVEVSDFRSPNLNQQKARLVKWKYRCPKRKNGQKKFPVSQQLQLTDHQNCHPDTSKKTISIRCFTLCLYWKCIHCLHQVFTVALLWLIVHGVLHYAYTGNVFTVSSLGLYCCLQYTVHTFTFIDHVREVSLRIPRTSLLVVHACLALRLDTFRILKSTRAVGNIKHAF